MIPAASTDGPEIDSFLQLHMATSMFLRANLRRHGTDGGSDPLAQRMWLVDRPVTGVLGLTNHGFVSIQTPSGVPDSVRNTLLGERIRGITGPPAQVTELAVKLGFGSRPELETTGIEPLYRLDLNRLDIPDGSSRLRPLVAADVPKRAPWRQAYRHEVDGFPVSLHQATQDLTGWVKEGRMRILEDADTPLAMTGFNAVLPDVVQIGGVYTPPDLRGRGHARRAVALHLAEARAQGVATAILFAASAAASRTYEAIGFQRIGTFQILLFPEPREVTA